MEAKYQALSVEELNAELALVQSLLPSGDADKRAVFHQTFQLNDKNKDDHITPGDEFVGLVDKLFDRFGVEKTEENYAKYFADIDADSDGKITLNEFVEYIDKTALAYVIPALEAEIAKRQ
ncbi:UNKNOWN [Stylonychia lemnae]|uniref:EF-hand domain-containing protein n=1 Tax=Stylonychia lemnae TaxID=5949 RepID=A0A078A669_STYLE|nr:UNKNOWN [Stylonychia lemnae]|eukprot:CDW77750.1 UNKNOWN [Stylonychia lemnae]